MVPCYYSKQFQGTIFSPTDIVQSNLHQYTGWTQTADVVGSTGTVTFIAVDGINHTTYDAHFNNGLWYHYMNTPMHTPNQQQQHTQGYCHRLTDSASYELWHQRLGHPGHKVMDNIHKHTTGVPKLRGNQFYQCASCMDAKFKKRAFHTKRVKFKTPSQPSTPPEPAPLKGQNLYCDFGFVRGSDWSERDKDGKLITSKDGYRSYCLIIDKATRYIWIHLTKTKEPPTQFLQNILNKYHNPAVQCTIRTDQGKELGRSTDFQKTVADCQYSLQLTGADSSAQNGMAEKPNQDLARIMRCLLHGASLSSPYWSYALRHAVYLKNRICHSALAYKTPYEAMTGTKPDLSHLRVFGAKVHIKKSGRRNAKLDSNNTEGTFLTYGGTDKNVYVTDSKTKREKLTTHVIYDEAHMSVPPAKQPPMAVALQKAGYRVPLTTTKENPTVDATTIEQLPVKLLSDQATAPTRGSANSAGLDLYSSETALVPPHTIRLIDTDISIELQPETYGQIQSRSSLAAKDIVALGGVIDADYRGPIKIILKNASDKTCTITKGQRIAQLIVHRITLPTPKVTTKLSTTARNDGGFGSTDIQSQDTTPGATTNKAPPQAQAIPQLAAPSLPVTPMHTPKPRGRSKTNSSPSPRTISPEPDSERIYRLQAEVNNLAHITPPEEPPTIELPYQIQLSTDPYDNLLTRVIKTRHNDPYEGFNLQQCAKRNLPYIKTIRPGTAAAKLPQWRRTLRNAYVHQIGPHKVYTVKQCQGIFKTHPQGTNITIVFGTIQKVNLHPDNGIPMMYFDQLNTIGQHLHDMKYNTNLTEPHPTTPHQPKATVTACISHVLQALHTKTPLKTLRGFLPKSKQRSTKLTRRKLQKLDNWQTWQASEWKQLQQYEDQQTFGPPGSLPDKANCLNLLWTYMVKDDGTHKARCVCNGRPQNPGTVTWGETYAKALDQVGNRIFWSVVALRNYIVRGSDASNAFAEADPPKAPLYVTIDKPFREWWASKGRPPIPPDAVMLVKKALQGHPESPRLWARLIHKIITTKIGLTSTTHEPCLYHGTYQDKPVMFLRQVDDFAVAANDEQTCLALIADINSHMTINVKDLGRLKLYNGLDILQARYYIKLTVTTYIDKVIAGHTWITDEMKQHTFPIPINATPEYIHKLENAIPPTDEKERNALSHRMGLNYRQAVGELIYAMVACRPDISFPIIKLSQYSNNPAQVHYEAVKEVLLYIKATKTEGLYYWRTAPNLTLPEGPLPTTKQEPYISQLPPEQPKHLEGACDSDWAGDMSHRKSVTGIILRLANGTIFYKSQLQQTVAHSSTEAEFTAACETGKACLYVRSILEEINVPQPCASTIYIDNNGALLMANASQPTRRTRHMDIKTFALQDWVERDLMIFKRSSTSDNYSDGMTKALQRTLHYRHFDKVMGRIIPAHLSDFISSKTNPASQDGGGDTLKSLDRQG